jgi:hypothetical protein
MLPRVRVAIVFMVGLAYAAASAVTSLYALVVGLFGCYESCTGTGDWTTRNDAWQWDLIAILGLAAGVAVLVTLLTAIGGRWARVPKVALAAHALVLLVAAAFLLQEVGTNLPEVLFWVPATIGSGTALVYMRDPRQIEGARRE